MTDAFRVIVLGCEGGPLESNLSGYLLYPTGTQHAVALDAGTLLAGLHVAHAKGNLNDFNRTFTALTPVGEVLQHKLNVYLISHAHLDHIVGLVINSQSDGNKHIFGIDSTINHLRDHIFNWITWPNYANEGTDPCLSRYEYVRLAVGEKTFLPRVHMTVEAFLLSHPHEYQSTAFLLESKGEYVLYFGDTSPDSIEQHKYMHHVWERVAPIVKDNKLRGIFLECSVSSADEGQVNYGHLSPRMMIQELSVLQKLATVPLDGLKVIVTHRKESLYLKQDALKQIETELTELNQLGVHFIFPLQGDKILL